MARIKPPGCGICGRHVMIRSKDGFLSCSPGHQRLQRKLAREAGQYVEQVAPMPVEGKRWRAIRNVWESVISAFKQWLGI